MDLYGGLGGRGSLVGLQGEAAVAPLFGRSELVLTWTFGAVGLAAAVYHRSWAEFATDWLPDESVARQFSRTGWLSCRFAEVRSLLVKVQSSDASLNAPSIG